MRPLREAVVSPSIEDVLGQGGVPGGGRVPWSYECSICHERFAPGGDMTHHANVEREKPTWPGHMTWTRVDDP